MHSDIPDKSDVEFQSEFDRILKQAGSGVADFSYFVFPAAHYPIRVFNAKCIFEYAKFTQVAYFSGAKFTQDADLNGTTFMMSANFAKTSFGRIADFREAKFRQNAEFLETEFRRDEELMPGPIFSRVVFSHPEEVVFYKTKLEQALFHNCDVSRLKFSSVTWRLRKNGKRKVLEEEEELNLENDFYEALRPRSNKGDERDRGNERVSA